MAAKRVTQTGKPTNLDEAVQVIREFIPDFSEIDISIRKDNYYVRGVSGQITDAQSAPTPQYR